MTFLVKRMFFISYYSTLMLCKHPEITYMKSLGIITEVIELRYFPFENYLLLKINQKYICRTRMMALKIIELNFSHFCT